MNVNNKNYVVMDVESKISVEYFASREAAQQAANKMTKYHGREYVAVPRVVIVDPPKLSHPCHEGNECSCNTVTAGKDPMTIADLIKWLGNLDQSQQVWIYNKVSNNVEHFVPSMDIDMDRQHNRIIIDGQFYTGDVHK